MPKINGNDVAKHVRNLPSLKDIPILAISGTSWKIKEGLFDGYLRKPFKVEQLLGAVESLL